MVCPHCGSQLADGSRFCPYCSCALDSEEQAQFVLSEANDGQIAFKRFQPLTGTEPSPDNTDPMNDPRGMKWFKFIIYFQLFATAAANVFNAMELFAGTQYGEDAAVIYTLYPMLKTADMVFGVCCLAFAAFAIFVRFRLARFRRNGPTLYYLLMVLGLLSAPLYLAMAAYAAGLSLGDFISTDILISMAMSLVMLVINLIYFGKRKDLFVN